MSWKSGDLIGTLIKKNAKEKVNESETDFYRATRRDCYFSILREENENTSSLCSSLL